MTIEDKIRKIASYVRENDSLVIGSSKKDPKYVKVTDASIDGKVPGAIKIDLYGDVGFTIWNPTDDLSAYIISLLGEIYSYLPEEAKETDKERIARLEKEVEELKKNQPLSTCYVPSTPLYCSTCKQHFIGAHWCPVSCLITD